MLEALGVVIDLGPQVNANYTYSDSDLSVTGIDN